MTIIDIAKESGYSVTTVSRVLNNRKDVSPEAKKKIMEIVKAHNFVPNDNAKHLKQSVTKNILVIVKGTSNMLFASIIESIQDTVGSSEYTVLVTYLDEDTNEVEAAVRLCRERKPLGIFLLGGNRSHFEKDFEKVKVPCVLVTNRADDFGFKNLASVSTDDVRASEEAITYLIENGHKDIAVLGGDYSTSYTSQERHRGYVNALEKAGYCERKEYYEKARFSYDSAYRAMKRILDKKLPVTAVFAMSDVMAIGAIRAIFDAGLKVPEDISIVGFDGTELANYYNPKIVTIRQGYEQIATRSVEILLRMIDLNSDGIHELVPFELKNTESVRKI